MTCPACGSDIPATFRFCGNCGHKLAEAAAPAAPAAPAAALGDQRRWVTVLFADVSGFTKMCEQLDPEEVQAVMNECFAGLGGAIQEEEGYIDKYIGDNVMALFGALVAHEDDPARACRAALAMQAFLSGFAERRAARTGTPLRMRIGINCGLVLAGEIGSDVRTDYSVMGDAVNLASRLESAAPPGGVLVSAEVDRQGPAVDALLPELEQAGLVAGGGSDVPTRWVFCQPLMQEACYETLLLRERWALHAETAQALCERLGGAERVSPALLAHHYERAERWTDAAAANLRAGLQAADVFLNDEATRRYQRVLDAIGRLSARSDTDTDLEAGAHRGATLVHLRVGAYESGEQEATAMRAVARRAADRAEADRLLATMRLHTGRTDEAERLLAGAVAEARDDREAGDVAVRALHDLAALYHRANRNAEALERLREARAAAGPRHRLTLVRADLLEGNIAHTEGRFAEATPGLPSAPGDRSGCRPPPPPASR